MIIFFKHKLILLLFFIFYPFMAWSYTGCPNYDEERIKKQIGYVDVSEFVHQLYYRPKTESELVSLYTLSVSAQEGNYCQALYVLKKGVKINEPFLREDRLWTPLDWAAYKGDIDFIRFLMDYGAHISLSQVTSVGREKKPHLFGPMNAFFLAAVQGHIEAARYLLKVAVNREVTHGINMSEVQREIRRNRIVNFQNFNNKTALFYAVFNRDLKMVYFLIEEAGINKEIQDYKGKIASDYACEEAHWYTQLLWSVFSVTGKYSDKAICDYLTEEILPDDFTVPDVDPFIEHEPESLR